MAAQNQFEAYFRRADLDQDGRISGAEAVAFFQASNLPKPVLAQIWTYVDQSHTGFLSRQEFYNYLKLVTVAQKRELTPEIVKAALFTLASAKIPAPQINLAAIPGPRPVNNVGAVPPVSGAAVTPVSSAAPTAAPSFGIRGQQGLPAQQSQYMRPPRPPIPSTGFQSQPGVSGQGMPGAGTVGAFTPPRSSDLLAGNGGSHADVTSQATNMAISSRSQDGFNHTSPQQNQQKTAYSTLPGSSKLHDATLHGNQPDAKDSKAAPVTGNRFASDSAFGDVFSAASVQPNQNSTPSISSASSLPISVAMAPAYAGLQHPVKASSVDSQVAFPQQTVNQHQQAQLTGRPNQQVSVPSSVGNPNPAGNSLSSQSQLPWPRMTHADYQKYSKVFMAVDTDRDGKITGQEARNLFLSWKLPREVLIQVWDLSDQDNDSMLSLREFCIALYLMERHREGRPLPSVLPNNLIFDESLLPASGQPSQSHGAAWRHTAASQQTQGPRGARQVASGAPGKPPRPGPIPLPNEAVQPSQQKPKVPALEKHLVDQLSQEEQDALNSKFQEATDAEKKVMELEKEISDAKQKIQFFHSKMQELILYKSRCDNRLNEITERTSADKREVELLAKKYEEKYKQTGDVASKLTIEEATFRDIQEKKMELYKEIVKMDQDGKTDGIQDRASHIQVDLEELVKALNERCKTYGLRAKPTTLLELPFGWQQGIQEGAANWDEDWDKFEDEGFTFVKELTLDVKNVTAPPKPKSSLVREKAYSLDERDTRKSSADADTDAKVDKLPNHGQAREASDQESAHGDQQTARSPTDSPSRSNAVKSPSKEFRESMYGKDVSFDGSPHAAQSEHGVTESVFSRDKGFDEPGWGTFDTNFDTDAAWDLNSVAEDTDHANIKESSLFGADDWGLSPIKTGSKQSTNTLPKQSLFFDSVPSTPSYNSGFTQTDSLFSRQSPFFDSVPSTPAYNSGGSPRGDNMFQKNSPFAFAESVPSTPMYSSTNSPRRFSEGFEEQSNNFSRFDSFNMSDSGPFGTRESLSRFDSMRSTRDSDFNNGSFQQQDSLARFDTFRSTADSDYNFGLFPPRESVARFDSIRSTRDTDYGHGFQSFDDADPFGSNEPFKTTVGSQTPRRDSDSWKAF